MPRPSVYLDECVDHALVAVLRARGFMVTSAQTEGTVGVSDEEQLAYAAQHDLVILSHNRRHFWRWHARCATAGRPHAGIVILPQTSPLP